MLKRWYWQNKYEGLKTYIRESHAVTWAGRARALMRIIALEDELARLQTKYEQAENSRREWKRRMVHVRSALDKAMGAHYPLTELELIELLAKRSQRLDELEEEGDKKGGGTP